MKSTSIKFEVNSPSNPQSHKSLSAGTIYPENLADVEIIDIDGTSKDPAARYSVYKVIAQSKKNPNGHNGYKLPC